MAEAEVDGGTLFDLKQA